MRVSLDFVPPFEPGIFDFLAARAVAGVEVASSTSYARTLSLPGGHGWFCVTWAAPSLFLDFHLEDEADAGTLLALVRHLFDLDHRSVDADAALAVDPLLAPRIAQLPGLRLPGCVSGAEILVRAMIGQQITVAAARTQLNQLTVLSQATRLPLEGLSKFFPTPAEIAAGGSGILRGPAKRIESILAVAGLLADGSLVIGGLDTPETLAEKLLPIPGIGPWTVGYVSMRVLGSADVFLPSDSAVRNGYGLLRGDTLAQARGIKPRELIQFAEPLSPWRSYATLHLWRRAGEKP